MNIGLAGLDYIALSLAETFTSGSNSGATKCVNITINDDEVLEGNQTFFLTLTATDSSVIIGTSATVITIIDIDS